MTESDWNSCTDPQAMLDWLGAQGKLSDRKARLFAVACGRRIWALLTDERSRRAVDVAEQQADGLANRADLATVRSEAADACEDAAPDDGSRAGANAATFATDPDAGLAALYAAIAAQVAVAAWVTFRWPSPVDSSDRWDAAREDEEAGQAVALRDIFNPFRPSPFLDPRLPTPAVIDLAHSAYDDRKLPAGTLDLARLAVLSDALEEAGCTDAELLAHLRSPGPHVRGCFALDLILARS